MMHALFTVLVICGWVLGVAGFVRTRQLRADVDRLRASLARLTAGEEPPTPARVEIAPPSPPEAPPVIARENPPPAWNFGDLEALLTMRWGVWLGAAALLFAGVFLVRYAVDQGLLGPAIRCALAVCLGIALLAAAEFLMRRTVPGAAGRFRVDQAPPALAAGGVAVLLGAAYGAGPYFGLLPPLLSLAALAAASIAGLAASLRFGPLTAAIGIVGAFVTPALVATRSPSLPGLFIYLFLVCTAALSIVRGTGWLWLAWASMTAGAAWVCVSGFTMSSGHWAPAAFVPAAALLTLAVLPSGALDHPAGRRLFWGSFGTLAAAGLLLQSLQGGMVQRGALLGCADLALAPIAVWKARIEPRLDRLPWLAALAGILALLCWGLPAWTPQTVRPLLIAAILFASFNGIAGLALERTAPVPVRWAALAAATPVVTLAVAYARIERFQADAGWALAALGLAAWLTVQAAVSRARRGLQPNQCAGTYAAGSVAALALGCAMVLHDQWLTLAIAMFLPVLPWVEARADLPAMRPVAAAVAGVVLIRLLPNWHVAFYDLGRTPLWNGLLAAYAAPAIAFGLASIQFRRRRDDRLVAVLEAGAAGLTTIFVALEIHHLFGDGNLVSPVGFDERAVQLCAAAALATVFLIITMRARRPVIHAAAMLLGGIALALGIAVIVVDPAFTNAPVSAAYPSVAYLAPALLATAARRLIAGRSMRDSLLVYAVLSLFSWLTLQIRMEFHPGATGLQVAPVLDAELWAWSGAWLVYGGALMIIGIRGENRLLRILALIVIGLVCIKVFLVDMRELTGLWRVVSFLGLGLALIGLGSLHRRLVLAGPPEPEHP